MKDGPIGGMKPIKINIDGKLEGFDEIFNTPYDARPKLMQWWFRDGPTGEWQQMAAPDSIIVGHGTSEIKATLVPENDSE